MKGMAAPVASPAAGPGRRLRARTACLYVSQSSGSGISRGRGRYVDPADESGPGALDAGVLVFIDRQLGGEFGRGDRLYLQGPFAEGTPSRAINCA